MSTVPSLLLTDSTMPVSFCAAGSNCALAMLGYFGHRLHMVAEVRDELERKAIADGSPALRRFLDEFPEERVRVLDRELAVKVAVAKKVIQLPGAHPNEDLGEVASVFYAAQCRDAGEVFAVVTDDGEGKKLARDRALEVITTASLVLEMVDAEAFPYADGERVWRKCVGRKRWKEYRAAVERVCPERIPAPR